MNVIKNETVPELINNCNENNNNIKNKLIIDNGLKKEIINFFNDFEISDIICQRNNASIYKCIYKKNRINKNFIIKSIKKSKKKSKYTSKEIEIHQKLKHNHIINLVGYYDLETYYAIISDFQKYGDLHQFQISYLKKRILSETFLCYLTGQILEAIQYIHKSKILHLDIKQKNILVNDFMQFKLIDSSISIDYKNKDYINLPLAGTFGHMSPEVLIFFWCSFIFFIFWNISL
jgi:serine/threonine protein kinase